MGEPYGKCPDHNPYNHHDNKQRWCDGCGKTAYGLTPTEFPPRRKE